MSALQEAGAQAPQPRMWLLPLVPVVVAGSFIGIELLVLADHTSRASLNGTLTETARRSIELSVDLAKWFIGLSIGVMGAVVYYRQTPTATQVAPSHFARLTTVGSLLCAGLSIFFGHLWLAGIRNQLGEDNYDGHGTALKLPEQLQYLCFIVALCWFALLVLERELATTPYREKPGRAHQDDKAPEKGP